MIESSEKVDGDLRTVKMLVVDDDTHDQFLFDMAAQECRRPISVDFVSEGAGALKFLKQAKKADRMPDVVVLDIRMPDMDGHETLRLIREDPDLSGIDAVMFSNSRRQSEIRRSIAEGALWHEVKPNVYSDLVAFIDQVVARVLSS